MLIGLDCFTEFGTFRDTPLLIARLKSEFKQLFYFWFNQNQNSDNQTLNKSKSRNFPHGASACLGSSVVDTILKNWLDDINSTLLEPQCQRQNESIFSQNGNLNLAHFNFILDVISRFRTFGFSRSAQKPSRPLQQRGTNKEQHWVAGKTQGFFRPAGEETRTGSVSEWRTQTVQIGGN